MGDQELGLHGATTWHDAAARFGEGRLRRSLRNGEWSSPWRGVLVESRRAGDALTMSSAAVQFAGGDGAVVAGPTAACLHGCRAVEPLPVHLVVPYGHWLRSRQGLVVHNGPLPQDDLEVVRGLPVLALKRVLSDLLCRARQQDALAVLDEVLARIEPSRRPVFRADLADRVAARSDPRGKRRAERLLDLATGRAESPAESWLLWWVVDAGFPIPEVNWRIDTIDGREIYRLDLAWPDLRIALEYDGHVAHAGREQADEARTEDLRRRGWLLVRARSDDLSRPARLERELDDAFRARGVDTTRRCVGTLHALRHREPRR